MRVPGAKKCRLERGELRPTRQAVDAGGHHRQHGQTSVDDGGDADQGDARHQASRTAEVHDVAPAIVLFACCFMSSGSLLARKTFLDGVSADWAEMPREEVGCRGCEPLEQDAHVAAVVLEIAHVEVDLGRASHNGPAKEVSHQCGPGDGHDD